MNTIKIKRKTTTGEPDTGQLSVGEMCWVVPDKAMYIKDASGVTLLNGGSGGGVASPQPIITLRTTVGQGADSTSNIAIQWNNQQDADSAFTHSTSTNNSRITVEDAGSYQILGAINYNGTTTNYRFSSEVTIRINGSIVLDRKFKGSYIRATTGADDTSVVFATAVKLNAGDYIEILSRRINTQAGNATVTDGSSISMVKLSGTKGAQGAQGPAGGTVSTNNTTLYFEENANLNPASNNGFQWSIGNGAENEVGFIMDHSGSVRALSLVTGTATTGEVELYKNGVATGETVILTSSTKAVSNITPVSYESGDNISAKTISGSGGGYATLGIGIASDGSKGDKGDKGDPGNDGADGQSINLVTGASLPNDGDGEPDGTIYIQTV